MNQSIELFIYAHPGPCRKLAPSHESKDVPAILEFVADGVVFLQSSALGFPK
jgi:hypothetical protein